MSQHYFNTQCLGTVVTALLGWDRPLGHYFMVIEEEDKDDYLYSNLDEPNPFGLTLDYFREILVQFEIQVPSIMFENVASDKDLAVGNRVVKYKVDGEFTETH